MEVRMCARVCVCMHVRLYMCTCVCVCMCTRVVCMLVWIISYVYVPANLKRVCEVCAYVEHIIMKPVCLMHTKHVCICGTHRKRVSAHSCKKDGKQWQNWRLETYFLRGGEEVVYVERVPPPGITHRHHRLGGPQWPTAHEGEEDDPHGHHQHVGGCQSGTDTCSDTSCSDTSWWYKHRKMLIQHSLFLGCCPCSV